MRGQECAVAPAGSGPALRVTIGEDDVLLREGIARILTTCCAARSPTAPTW